MPTAAADLPEMSCFISYGWKPGNLPACDPQLRFAKAEVV
jgi:hypothetical protein